MNRDRLNGWGTVFRFITPVLITLVLFILQQVREDMKEIGKQFDNHLRHHQDIEVRLEGRLSSIETILKRRIP